MFNEPDIVRILARPGLQQIVTYRGPSADHSPTSPGHCPGQSPSLHFANLTDGPRIGCVTVPAERAEVRWRGRRRARPLPPQFFHRLSQVGYRQVESLDCLLQTRLRVNRQFRIRQSVPRIPSDRHHRLSFTLEFRSAVIVIASRRPRTTSTFCDGLRHGRKLVAAHDSSVVHAPPRISVTGHCWIDSLRAMSCLESDVLTMRVQTLYVMRLPQF
jgi:hypothetical protein